MQLALPTAPVMQAINVGVTVGGPLPASVPVGEGRAVPGWLFAFGLLAAAGAGAALAVPRHVVTCSERRKGRMGRGVSGRSSVSPDRRR
jgi:hypothetical protein